MGACQKALGTGYLSAFPATAFDTLESKHGGVWAPHYTIHKIMTGLLDCNEAFSDKQALAIVQGMTDYFSGRMAKLTPDQIEGVLLTIKQGPQNEFGGMSDVFTGFIPLQGERRISNWQIFLTVPGSSIRWPRGTIAFKTSCQYPHPAGDWLVEDLTTGEKHYSDAVRFFGEEVARKR